MIAAAPEVFGVSDRAPDAGDRSPYPGPRDGTSAGEIERNEHAQADVGPGGRVTPSAPGTLDVSIRRRGEVIDVGLAGDLDVTTAPRLGDAMALARHMATVPHPGGAAGPSRRPGRAATIVIDTSDVDVLDAAGHRALTAVQVGPNGLWDPGVVCIVGPAVARLEASVAARPAPAQRS